MIKKVEKVIKGMNRFSSEDIALILETEPLKIEPVLNSLEQDGKIKKIAKTIYSKIQKIAVKTEKKLSVKPDKKTLIKLKPKEYIISRITDLQGYEEYLFASPKTKERIKKYIKLMKETHGMSTAEITKYINNRKNMDKISAATFLKARRKLIKSGLKDILPKRNKHIPAEFYAFFKNFYLSTDNLTSKQARTKAIRLFIKKYPNCRLRQIPKDDVLFKKLRREYSIQEIHRYRTPDFSLFDLDELEKV